MMWVEISVREMGTQNTKRERYRFGVIVIER